MTVFSLFDSVYTEDSVIHCIHCYCSCHYVVYVVHCYCNILVLFLWFWHNLCYGNRRHIYHLDGGIRIIVTSAQTADTYNIMICMIQYWFWDEICLWFRKFPLCFPFFLWIPCVLGFSCCSCKKFLQCYLRSLKRLVYFCVRRRRRRSPIISISIFLSLWRVDVW